MLRFVFVSFFLWRLWLFIIEKLGKFFIVSRTDFLGSIPWANFDGLHYLSIAQYGYFQYQQAFFPFFPLLTGFISLIFKGDYLISAIIISHVSFFISLLLLYKLTKSKWLIVCLLFFPTSFFFASVYTESLFLCLVLGYFYSLKKEKWLAAGILSALAGATRIVGIILFPILLWKLVKEKEKTVPKILSVFLSPLGLFAYMFYLWREYGDPLMFFHVQSFFGANRSSEEIIFFPQVIYRYLKIFFLANFSFEYLIALFEFLSVFFAIFVLLKNRKKLDFLYQFFAWFLLILPTLTGTFSSMPRYILIIFPIFIVLGNMNFKFKIVYILFSFILLTLFTVLFLNGYFIS